MCCPDGWKTCLVGSRFTNRAEGSYSATEGEMLAIQDSFKKSKFFTLGCDDLIVGTDHKPLLGILNNKELEKIDNPRLFRLKVKTLPWKFSIIHIPGKLHGGPDCLSRYGFESKPTQDALWLELDEAGETTQKEVRQHLFTLLLKESTTVKAEDVDDDEYLIASIQVDMKPITWEEVKEESKTDQDILDAIAHFRNGNIKAKMSDETARLVRLRNQIRENDGMLLYKDRPIIPKSLRRRVLEVLHSAHQGVSSMISRAEDSVFWPNISADIRSTRIRCLSCDKSTPSQSNLPAVDPVIPDHPFQHISADYLSFGGHSYGVIVDRFSNWFQVYGGKGGASTFIAVLRRLIENFNIPETLTTDGGSQYIAEETQKFLLQYGIKHRLCSVGYPHANTRAELGVKSAKRLLRENIGFNGSLDTVKMSRALITHRNTPDRDTGLSPAEMMIGRKLRGFLPGKILDPELKSEQNLAQGWRELADWRELALAKRASRDQERWSTTTRSLAELPLGTHVAIQNQLGNHPKKWDKRGVIVEVLPFQQYKVRVDGSRRLTLRNRKFLRPFTPMFKETSSWSDGPIWGDGLKTTTPPAPVPAKQPIEVQRESNLRPERKTPPIQKNLSPIREQFPAREDIIPEQGPTNLTPSPPRISGAGPSQDPVTPSTPVSVMNPTPRRLFSPPKSNTVTQKIKLQMKKLAPHNNLGRKEEDPAIFIGLRSGRPTGTSDAHLRQTSP